MRRLKYNEANVPTYLHVRVKYLHTVARGPWLTNCQLIDNLSGKVVAVGVSMANPKDQVNRKIGRAIAVGRALKEYHESELCQT